MGFLKNLFGKSSQESKTSQAIETEKNTIYSPLKGTVIPLKEIGDGVFSEGILGQGCGIKPDCEEVVAPCDGEITSVTDTLHAISIRSMDGVEVIIHVGMDTVAMNGKGFKVHVKVGDRVKCGQRLMNFSKKAIAEAGFVDTTAVIVINTEEYESVDVLHTGDTQVSEKILQVK